MPVDKKYLKIGVACLAVTALVIGLSVGLTQKNKNINSAASSNAAYETYDIIDTADTCYGKSGKSEGGSAKSGKSGYSGSSMRLLSNRELYVPGILEAYGDGTDASTGKRSKLRHQLFGRELYGSAKSGKSSGGYGYGSAKSGKSGSVSSSCYYEDVCKGSSGKSGKSGGSGGSGKSGKSESCSRETTVKGTNPALPVDIPDATNKSNPNPGTVSVTLTVEDESLDDCTIEDVDITGGITHPFAGQLQLTLSSPGAEKTAVLIDRQGGASDLVSNNPITFDDASSTDPSTIGGLGIPVIPAGTFFSEGDGSGNNKLSNFTGGSPPGNWTFTAIDFAGGDTGTIDSVELRITSNCPCEPSLVGSAKSGKSEGYPSTKSDKSSPTTCGYPSYGSVQTTEAPPFVMSTTVASQECICEEQPWIWDGAMCVRSCDVTGPGPGSKSATACCASNTGNPDCPIDDCGFVPSPSPTEGGTTTVATEKDGGDDTQDGDRGPLE